MSKRIVPLMSAEIMEEARDWESRVFEQVCVAGQQQAAQALEVLEEALDRQRPVAWVVVGFRERTLVTRFGEVGIRRRLYRDGQGGYHFLLDEYLGWNAYQAATVEMQALCTILCGEISFRKAADFLEQWLAGLLSHSTCWRLVQRTGEVAASARAAEVEAVFGCGEPIVPAGKRGIERLYVEADGVYVRLQKQSHTHLELLSAIAYEGWERMPQIQEAYRLREKQVYCHAGDRVSFWEGASLAWADKWDFGRVHEVIIGGDGAGWIRAGVDVFAHATWQLDGFHLARACRQTLGSRSGQKLYQALRAGKTTAAQTRLRKALLPAGRQAQRTFHWLEKIAQEQWGLDWRVRQGLTLEDAHGLGCMEGNQAQLLAARMKGKGRSWSPRGASHMAKVRELLTNHDIQRWCYRPTPFQKPPPLPTHHVRIPPTAPGQWLQAALPAFYGPFPNAPWVQALRRLIHPALLLN